MALSILGGADADDFIQIGPPRQIPGGLGELDTLEITYQGGKRKLAQFLGTFQKWKASSLDSGMFLESFPNDGDLVKPTVTARYIGLLRGAITMGRKESGQTVQSASSTRTFSAPLTSPTAFTAEITYYSPTNTYTWISASKGEGGSADQPTGNIQIISSRVNGANPGKFSADVLSAYFEDQITNITQSSELVPGKYWRNTNIKNKVKIARALLA